MSSKWNTKPLKKNLSFQSTEVARAAYECKCGNKTKVPRGLCLWLEQLQHEIHGALAGRANDQSDGEPKSFLRDIFHVLLPLKGLLDFMEEDRKEATGEEDVKRMMIVAEISRKITITANIMCNSLVIFYGIMHLATNYTSARGLFFPAYFPWETKPSPYYEITFFGQLMGSFYACATYSVVDTFVATLVLHVCGQLANLRHELINLRRETSEEFHEKLGHIVKKHDYLNEFTETIENSFNAMLLIQMLGCTITLCLESFQTLEFLTGEKDKFFLLELGCTIFYVCYILIQLYLYCYVGEKLLSESTGIADAAYECEWYNLSPNEAKCLILIMRRARSPLRITAGKFCSFNHELFSEVVRTSMSYLSVLYAVKSED
ncbi:odorant receptor 13a-like [Vespula squamosa]|uniref:Odorant receptor n=1 Tax=Vespula squamosa TaxID=30214 RepID=A0ABD2A8A8_VESSQ